MKKWEYLTVDFDVQGGGLLTPQHFDGARFNMKLVQLGGQGWELMNCFNIDENGYTKKIVAVFKREMN